MLSALILTGRGYPAVQLAPQPVYQWSIEVPNRSVDLSSWERSACYPRSTFYPLSDGNPMFYHRITLPLFPAWSTCLSLSQARFWQCPHRTVAIRAERTLGSLRYSFGGDHPSQTTLQAVSSHPGVRPHATEGWYFNGDSRPSGDDPSQSPTYPTHPLHDASTKI